MSVKDTIGVGVPSLSRDQLVIGLLLLPLFLFFSVLWFIPMGYTAWSSFFADPLGTSEFVGLANYVDVVTSGDFASVLWNSIVYAVVSTLLSVVIGLAFALVVNKALFRGGVLRTMMVFPYLMPTVVVMFLWRFLLDQNIGPLNRVLLDLGIITEPLVFFGDPALAMPSVIGASVWKYGSFAFFILLANLQAIPDEYYTRAKIQGASQWQQFRDITLPHLRGAILLIFFVRGIFMFNKFDTIWLTTRGGPAGATTTLPISVYDYAIRLTDYGHGTALSMVMFAILAVVGVAYFIVLKPESEVTE